MTLSVWTASGSVCANPKHSNTHTQCKDSIVVIIMLAVKVCRQTFCLASSQLTLLSAMFFESWSVASGAPRCLALSKHGRLSANE